MKVYLLGDLGEKFGKEWTMNAPHVKDIIQLIGCQRPGFLAHLRALADDGVDFAIRRGEEFLGEEDLELSLGRKDVYISTVPAGAGGNVGKIIAGIALIAVAVVAPGVIGTYAGLQGAVAAVGINLALQGIQGLLQPGPEVDRDTPDSYIFNGPVNTVKEGLPVPVLYGEMIIGGAPINVTFTTRRPMSNGYMYTPDSNNNSFVATPVAFGGF